MGIGGGGRRRRREEAGVMSSFGERMEVWVVRRTPRRERGR